MCMLFRTYCVPIVARVCPQCCPPVTRPVSAVSGLRFIKAKSSFAHAVCGANAYDAGIAVGEAGLRMCVETAPMFGNKVQATQAGKFITSIAVVIKSMRWADIQCPPGFIKHEEDIDRSAMRDGSSIALCIQKARVATPLAKLVKAVTVHPNCNLAYGNFTRVRGDVSGKASGKQALHICISKEGASDARMPDKARP
jgi:hypothetical protein